MMTGGEKESHNLYWWTRHEQRIHFEWIFIANIAKTHNPSPKRKMRQGDAVMAITLSSFFPSITHKCINYISFVFRSLILTKHEISTPDDLSERNWRNSIYCVRLLPWQIPLGFIPCCSIACNFSPSPNMLPAK